MKFLFLPCLLLSCLSLSAQWDRQNPFNHLGIINDIQINGSFGAAVGDDAAIFISNDGGSSWTIRDNDLNGWNFAAVERDEDLIYACGRGIYKSEDGGETFNEIPNAPTEIFDSYLSESGALIVTNNGGVYKTLDQGATFTNLNTPVDSLGTTSFIYDENHIWWATAGSTPVLYITTDGGLNWEANTGLTRPNKLSFYNKDIGIATSLPYFYYTEDGGQTWEERGRLSRYFGKIVFGSSPDTAYMTSVNNFYSTYDGCASFNEYKSIIPSSDLNGLFKETNGKLLIGASFSSIAESEDEGMSWNDISGKIKTSISAMGSANGQQIYAGGNRLLLNTEDGGNTWTFFDSMDIVIQDMEIIEDEAIILSGVQKIIRKEIDTKEETTIYGPVPGIFENFHITPSGRWIAYSSRDYYLLSDDQGITWDSIYIEKFSNGMDMMENGDLFLRIRGKLLFSNDEGASWDQIYSANVELDIPTMSVFDSTIYLMESLRNLRKSTDYGLTWDSLATPTGFSMIVRDMHFINQDTGYIYDSLNDKLWYTYDGGQTWPFAYFPKVGPSGFYEFSNNDIQAVWIYGQGSFIEKQSDCKNPPLLSDIEGVKFPCILDTTTYSVNGSNIDNYVWTIPDEWVLVGSHTGPEINIYAKEPGVGYLTVYGENACGNTDALELQIAGTAIPDVVLLDLGTLLRTEADGVNFQWFKDGILIPGAEQKIYVPTENGDYTVLVTFSTTCSRLSNVITIVITSISALDDNSISIYPNPILGDYFNIAHSYNVRDINIEIRDILGKRISDINTITTSNNTVVSLPNSINSGLYFIYIRDFNYSKAIYINR